MLPLSRPRHRHHHCHTAQRGCSSEVGGFPENTSFQTYLLGHMHHKNNKQKQPEAHLRARQRRPVTDAAPRLDVRPLAVTSVTSAIAARIAASSQRKCGSVVCAAGIAGWPPGFVLLSPKEARCAVSVTFCHKSNLGSVSLKSVAKFPDSSAQAKQIQNP